MSNKSLQFNSFRYEKPISKDLTSAAVNKIQCSQSIRHLDIRSGEHIGVSALTGKKVKTSNNSAVCNHLLRYNLLHPLLTTSNFF